MNGGTPRSKKERKVSLLFRYADSDKKVRNKTFINVNLVLQDHDVMQP